MSLKKLENYRGYSIYLEQVRTGIWGTSVVEIPSGEADVMRTPSQGRLPGEFPSKDSALEAARTHIDRIQKNRRNRASQATT
jgi:hypothetical protein